MPLADEFPDFDPASLPTIPHGWIDQSWRNDACPSFRLPGALVAWIDFADPTQRDAPSQPRFALCRTDDEGASAGMVIAGDDWRSILDAVARHLAGLAISLEWGCAGQIDAENGLFAILHAAIGETPDFDRWSLKATTAEMVAEGLRLLGLEAAS